MNDEEDEQKWQAVQFQLNAAADLLIRAGWATRAANSPHGAAIELTEKGHERMDHLFEALEELDPQTMRAEHVMGLWLYLTLRDQRTDTPGNS